MTRLALKLIFICTTVLASNVLAEGVNDVELLKTRGPRNTFWAFESIVLQNNIQLPDGSSVSGPSGGFIFGFGRVFHEEWYSGRGVFAVGPWARERNGSFDADNYGSGLDLEYGRAMPGWSLRVGSVPILSLNLRYMESSGHNVGDNRNISGNPVDPQNYYLEQDFTVSTSQIFLLPSVGWAWVKPERPLGNEPELLATRVESYFIKMGVAVPVYSRAKIEVTQRSRTDGLSQSPQTLTTKGSTRGYAFVWTAGVWLGI